MIILNFVKRFVTHSETEIAGAINCNTHDLPLRDVRSRDCQDLKLTFHVENLVFLIEPAA